MLLGEFIEKFIEPNSLIRLWYKCKPDKEGMHKEVEGENLQMSHEFMKSDYRFKEVVGVTDILYRGKFSEAVNIVIEESE